MRQMVTPEAARQIILENVTQLGSESVPHALALGRTLAADVVSSVALPPFDNSAMDGYALHGADLQKGARLRVLETIAAGAFPQCEILPGTCARIMTGAPIPNGADAVVMREDTREGDDFVEILEAPRAGANIRRAGSDVAQGETVLRSGETVRAAQWGMLASLGFAQVQVSRVPRVLILTTGDELVAVDAPLHAGQIRDSNSFTLRALVQGCGCVVESRHIGDDPRELKAALDEAQCDAVITSGGVSAGDFDPVRDVLKEYAQVHFWKIAMKPGKPVMFASWPSARGAFPVFGLPGNPVSVMVAFEQFVRPALLQMQGRRALNRITLSVRVDAPFNSPQGKVEYVRAFVVPHETGWLARVTGDQGSGRLSTMTAANALLEIPAATTQVEKSQTVPALMIEWPEIE